MAMIASSLDLAPQPETHACPCASQTLRLAPMHPFLGRWHRTSLGRLRPFAIQVRLRVLNRRIRRYVLQQLVHADDPPHRLALGAAIGVFVTFTPTVGIQSFLVLFLAWLLRANKAIGLPTVWVTNPATIVPIYYPCYVIGRTLLGEPEIGVQWWHELSQPPPGTVATTVFYWDRMLEIAVPLWLGCLIVSTLVGVITYYSVYFGVHYYRSQRT